MLLVPYTKNNQLNLNQTPEEKYKSELDQKMSVILKNPKLSPEEKLKQYNFVLDLYLNKKKEEIQVLSKPFDGISGTNEELLKTILSKLSDFSKVPAVLPAHLGRSRFESPALAAASMKKKKILNATGYLFLRFNIV